MVGAYLRGDRDGIEQDLAAVHGLFPILATRAGCPATGCRAASR